MPNYHTQIRYQVISTPGNNFSEALGSVAAILFKTPEGAGAALSGEGKNKTIDFGYMIQAADKIAAITEGTRISNNALNSVNIDAHIKSVKATETK